MQKSNPVEFHRLSAMRHRVQVDAYHLSQARFVEIYLGGSTRARGCRTNPKSNCAPAGLLLTNLHRAQECGAPTLQNEWCTPQENHAWRGLPRVGEDLGKIQVIRQEYVAMTTRIIEDVRG